MLWTEFELRILNKKMRLLTGNRHSYIEWPLCISKKIPTHIVALARDETARL